MRVADAFRASVARWAERPVLCILPETADAYGIDDGEVTYAQAGALVDELAGLYAGLSGRVGLMLDNRPDFFWHWLALNACGVSVVPLNADLRPAELDYLVAHSGLAHAVVAPAYLERVKAAAERAPHRVAVRDASERLHPGSLPQGEGEGRAECALLYTSGTTASLRAACCPTTTFFGPALGIWKRAALRRFRRGRTG